MRALLLGLLVALVPATAQAATVTLVVHPSNPEDRHSTGSADARFAAAPGEVNDVRVVEDLEGLRFTDVVALQAGAGCRAVDERTVACPRGAHPEVDLGDGNDHLACEDLCWADGGPGDDVIEAIAGGSIVAGGGDGADVLRGGERSDELRGGPGADVLDGGGAHDDLVGDDPQPPFSPDRIDGGASDLDRVSYGGRRNGVEVTLGVGGGAPGEGDVVIGVERLEGGEGFDTLAGDDGPNFIHGGSAGSRSHAGDRLLGAGGDDRLEGGPGRDELDGGAGDDGLQGGRGPDRYRGGDGDDVMLVTQGNFVRSYAATELDCGAGADRLVGTSPRDRVERACETVEIGGLRFTRLGGPLAFRVAQVPDSYGCPARLQARSGRRTLSRPFRVHRSRTLRFPGFRRATMSLHMRGCWPGASRREKLRGGFRAEP